MDDLKQLYDEYLEVTDKQSISNNPTVIVDCVNRKIEIEQQLKNSTFDAETEKHRMVMVYATPHFQNHDSTYLNILNKRIILLSDYITELGLSPNTSKSYTPNGLSYELWVNTTRQFAFYLRLKL